MKLYVKTIPGNKWELTSGHQQEYLEASYCRQEEETGEVSEEKSANQVF
jgi:hypothetical protein